MDHPDFGVTDIAKETGRRWKEMSEQQKAPFVEMAADDKNRHKQEVFAYACSNALCASSDGVLVTTSSTEYVLYLMHYSQYWYTLSHLHLFVFICTIHCLKQHLMILPHYMYYVQRATY